MENVGEVTTSVAAPAIVSASGLPSLESDNLTEAVDVPLFELGGADELTVGSIFESALGDPEEAQEDSSEVVESLDAPFAHDEESMEAEASDENELKRARDELREEIDEGEEEPQEDVMSVEDQRRQLDERIAMLEFQLESLKKLRSKGIFDIAMGVIQHFIDEFFEIESQTQKSEQDKFNNDFIDSKIDVLGKEISRLKRYRTQVTANIAA